MRRAAWIILGGVVYVMAMSALGRAMRDERRPEDDEAVDAVTDALLRPLFRRSPDDWEGR